MEVKHLQVGTVKIEVHPSRNASGQAAAQAAAEALKKLDRDRNEIGVIFATGALNWKRSDH